MADLSLEFIRLGTFLDVPLQLNPRVLAQHGIYYHSGEFKCFFCRLCLGNQRDASVHMAAVRIVHADVNNITIFENPLRGEYIKYI
jgi:hypothetical protein